MATSAADAVLRRATTVARPAVSSSAGDDLWTPAEFADEVQRQIEQALEDRRFRVTDVLLAKSAGPLFVRSRRKLTSDRRPVTVHPVSNRWVLGKHTDRVRFEGFKRGRRHIDWVYLAPTGCDHELYVALRTQSGLGMRDATEAARNLT